ncbi:MAG: aldo/keto reductase [Gemmatimonadetes bacterium]|jgi:aryl-alcohol dehydrogenase-like predicted oxidoreductase|nr:aldo/keto reductase [Gemmatimonadota bacterium]MBT4609574.1 aldo/keto reductase [Gemmatimonadota bacterium]MBT5055283.1 aldo/keto reductase [Gemmatimonadota bacterium]MBT5142847.1 aldo/keto reductase [Gemmatimonadota bacterium]MBT5589440.1 aldo/keto reductase [Gemmatimonadota bacterium]
MQTVTLGRTGLQVSRMGVGAGGPSQIGVKTGRSEQESVNLLRRAFDAGVNLVDTSEGYGTEQIIGRALEGRDRDQIILSTKKSTRHKDVTPESVMESLDASLRRLQTDAIDIYNLHGVVPQDYRRLVEEIYPTLEAARQAGKIRFLGITEMFGEDRQHAMLSEALADDLWDVVMVGFNLLNQTARAAVLAPAIRQNVGVQVMFAVRKALGSEEAIVPFVQSLLERGEMDTEDVDVGRILDFALSSAASLPDLAYRFCRDEAGVHVVLSGTGNAEHLERNLESFEREPLPKETTQKLRHIFRSVVSTTGQSLD